MHVWLSGCRPAASGPPGFHTTARELQTCIFEGPGASNTTKIPREDPPERHKKSEMVAGEGEKARNFGPPTLRGPTLRGTEGCLFFCFFIFLFCFLKKKAKRKSDWPKSVKQRLATVGLAKVGISRIAVGSCLTFPTFLAIDFLAFGSSRHHDQGIHHCSPKETVSVPQAIGTGTSFTKATANIGASI